MAERKSVQVPVEIFEDIFLLFMLDDEHKIKPEQKAKAVQRIKQFLQEKINRDLDHEIYSQYGKRPDSKTRSEELSKYCFYLMIRKG